MLKQVDFSEQYLDIYTSDDLLISIYKKDYENYYTINKYFLRSKYIKSLLHHTTLDINELTSMINNLKIVKYEIKEI